MKVALVGNQNSGKTTIFNLLTGMNQKIGNWPGVTIEKKEGRIRGTNYQLIDLPGIYSLSPYSTEEELARKFIFEEKPDIIINVVDATNLERSLYLTTQLLELDCKVIVALNMMDQLERKGITINKIKLEKELGVSVYQVSALKGFGIRELINGISFCERQHRIPIFDKEIEYVLYQIEVSLSSKLNHKRFMAIKLLEDDNRFQKYNFSTIKDIRSKLEHVYHMDMEELIATKRYCFIEKIKKSIMKTERQKVSLSDLLDKIFLNKWIAFPIFFVILFFVYYISVGVVGKYTGEIISSYILDFGEEISSFLEDVGASEWLISLMVDGVLTGFSAVINFIPQLISLFFCIALLETSGYMSRIAMLLDRLFRKLGLSGKALIPFIVGSGCSVPGIMATRIIENEEERNKITILTPFIPCSAKLPIIVLFSSVFFQEYSGFVAISFYILAIILIIGSAYCMKKIRKNSRVSTYIAELPEYKLPDIKYIITDVSEKVIAFLRRASSVILMCSIIVWFLVSFSFKGQYGIAIEESMMATIGRKVDWFFYPILGENSWEATVSVVQGLIAKEQVISSMSIIVGVSESMKGSSSIFNSNKAFAFFSPASAYAFVLFNLFSAPCIGAISAMRKELGSTKKMFLAILFQMTIAYFIAILAFQIGRGIEVWYQ